MESAPAVAEPGSGQASLTIATYNIYADRPGDPSTLEAIQSLGADVVLLQEVSREWVPSLREVLADTHPHVGFWTYRQRWGGLAILSKHPFESPQLLSVEAGPFPAWRGVVVSPIGRIQVLNVHLFPPIRLYRRLGWLRAYRVGQERHVEELQELYKHLDPDLPTVIAGDFNEDVRGDGMAWLRERGFSPAIDEMRATWRWQASFGELRWQLDHIVYRGPLQVAEARVIEAGSSDHWPVVARVLPSP